MIGVNDPNALFAQSRSRPYNHTYLQRHIQLVFCFASPACLRSPPSNRRFMYLIPSTNHQPPHCPLQLLRCRRRDIIPIFQRDLAPAHGARGLFVSVEHLKTICYTVSTWVGYAGLLFSAKLSPMSSRQTRVVTGTVQRQAVLAAVLCVSTTFVPESPRWLIRSGFETDGRSRIFKQHTRQSFIDYLCNSMVSS